MVWGRSEILTGRQRVAAAEEVAAAARQHYELSVPIDPLGWCSQVGVHLQRQHQVEEGRYLRPSVGGASIVMRHGRETQRSRFAVAHELGHHFIEETRRSTGFRNHLSTRVLRLLSRIETGSPEEEQICDSIAGSLVLPAWEFSSRRVGSRPSLAELMRMARRHRVSVVTAMVRFHEISGARMIYALCQPSNSTSTQSSSWKIARHYELGFALPAHTSIRLDVYNEDGLTDHGVDAFTVCHLAESASRLIVWVDWEPVRAEQLAVIIMPADLD